MYSITLRIYVIAEMEMQKKEILFHIMAIHNLFSVNVVNFILLLCVYSFLLYKTYCGYVNQYLNQTRVL